MAKKQTKIIIGLTAVTLIAVLLASGTVQLGSIGYNQGTQGFNVYFNSVYREGKWFSATENKGGSSTFLSTMDLDPDNSLLGMPDLCANQGAFIRVSDTPVDTKFYDVSNGVLPDGTKNYTKVAMLKYQFTWDMNLYLFGTEREARGELGFPNSPLTPNYAGTQVWMKWEAQDFVKFYYDNGTEATPNEFFIAPALMQTADAATWQAVDKINWDGSPNFVTAKQGLINLQQFNQQAQGVVMGWYYNRGGSVADLTDTKIFSYQGVGLDPQLFRDNYWTYLDLSNFQPYVTQWGVPGIYGGYDYSFPATHIDFTGYVWVIGEWNLYFKANEVVDLGSQPVPIVTHTNLPFNLPDLFGNQWFTLLIVALAGVVVIFFLLNRKSRDSSHVEKRKWSTVDWGIIGILVVLAVIPDPTDILDFGLPILEPIAALGYYWWRRKG